MYGISFGVRLPSAIMKVDYKTEGGIGDDDKWFQ